MYICNTITYQQEQTGTTRDTEIRSDSDDEEFKNEEEEDEEVD
jgi:hypothetical protein